MPPEVILETLKNELQRSEADLDQHHAWQRQTTKPGRGQLCESPPIRHDVREDQREREEHKTEEKVENEACPFRLATLAGQNAIAIQMMKNKIEPSHQPFAATNTPASL